MPEHMGERIRRLRGRRNQEEIATGVGVSRVAISNWERGETKSISGEHLLALAMELGTTPEYLLSGDERYRHLRPAYGVADPAPDYGLDNFTFVPKFGVDVAAGGGAVVEHELVDTHLAFRTTWLKAKGLDPERLTVVTARGDSMGERIQDGDILLVDRRVQDIRDGVVYALNVGGEARVKRLYVKVDGTIVLHSDNRSPQYRDEHIPPGEQQLLNIVGRVVWVGGEI